LGMPLQVNTTVTIHNRHQLEATYELVRKLGASAWHLFLLVPVGCGLEIAGTAQLTPRDYEQVLYWIDEIAQREAERGAMDVRAICAPHAQRIRLQRREAQGQSSVVPDSRQGCLAGISMCFISYRGEVFPCGYLPVAAGDIRRQPFGAIWASAPIFAQLRDPNLLGGKCGGCEYRVVCGGCRARAFGETGHYLDEEPFCNYLPAKAPFSMPSNLTRN
jgi:radical SAM protein with 4Fe4S-binding SPASM domain